MAFTMRYTITVTNGTRIYTAYNGVSFKAATAAVEFARAVLILGGGNGQINATYNGARLTVICVIEDGEASAIDALAAEVA